MKFFDVPATVGRAIAALSQKGVDLATIHGNDAIMEYAVKNKGDLKVPLSLSLLNSEVSMVKLAILTTSA